MIDWLLPILASTVAGPLVSECTTDQAPGEYHLASVCDDYLEGEPAYSATVEGSLIAKPASQQVMLYKMDGQWFVRIAGFSWDSEGPVLTRRIDVSVSNMDAQRVIARLDDAAFERLGTIEYYGDKNRICMDGANYEVARAVAGTMTSARQHSCAGKTEINAVMAIFRKLAIKYDPEAEGMLYWLKD